MIGSVESLSNSLAAVSLSTDPIDDTARGLITLSYQQLYQSELPASLQAELAIYQAVLSNVSTCNLVLEHIQAYLNRTSESSIDLLRQRIHVRHFLLLHVIKDKSNITSTDNIRVALNRDLAKLFEMLTTSYLSNQIPLGENQAQLQQIHAYHALFSQQLPAILALFDKVLAHPDTVAKQTRVLIYKHLWQDHVNFVNCEFAYCKVYYLHNDLESAKVHFNLAEDKIALLQTRFRQLIDLKCVQKNVTTTHKLALFQQRKEINGMLTQKDKVNPFQFSLNIMKKLATFEAQFLNDLTTYQRNICNDTADTSVSETTTTLKKQIEDCITGVQNASKEKEIACYLIEMHFSNVLVYLHQIDQIKNIEEAKILLPLMMKLLIQWQAFFKQPNVLLKHNIETLKRITNHLVTELRSIQGTNSSQISAAKIDNCLLLGETIAPIATKTNKKPKKRGKNKPSATIAASSVPEPAVLPVAAAVSNTQKSPPSPVLPALNQGEIPVAGINIPIRPEAEEVLTILHSHGYEAYIAGGYVRDCLLNVTPKDVDMITNCPREKVMEWLGANWSANPFKNHWFHGKNMDLVCTTTSMHQEASQRDLTINALFADRFGNVYDPLGVIDDIKKATVQMIGEPAKRFPEDPKRLLRAIRIPMHVGKQIPDGIIAEIKLSLHTLTTLNFGAYLSEIHKTFGGGQGEKCGAFLIVLQRFDALTATASITDNSSPSLGDSLLNYFLQAKLKQADIAFSLHRPNCNYHTLALVLLPNAVKICGGMPGLLLEETLEDLLTTFGEKFPGQISIAEKNCIVKATKPLLLQFYAEFVKLQASTSIPEFIPKQTPRTTVSSAKSTPSQVAPSPAPKPRSYTPGYQQQTQSHHSRRQPRKNTLADFITVKQSPRKKVGKQE